MSQLGRNDTCHCGSGKKYKRCHLPEDDLLRLGAKWVEKFVPHPGLVRFDQFCPDVADKESRAIWALGKDPRRNEPYFIMEFYCDDITCDCKRVVLCIIDMDRQSDGTIVSVGYAFDRNDPEPGPYIDPLNPITPRGRELYPIIERMLEGDEEFVERLQRHYRMVKVKVAQGRSRALH